VREVRTAHGVFQASKFQELPGWSSDDLSGAWLAFAESCKVLERRPVWRDVCQKSRSVPARDNAAMRRFFEREFTLLGLANRDASRDGDVTGYYEPLLSGSPIRQGKFTVPVHGVPNDLYTLDWKLVPDAQRRSEVWVRAAGSSGRVLTVVPANTPGATVLNLRNFDTDVLDRRLRVRLSGNQALPYFTRDEILSQARLDAATLAWVDDPVALYAMQVQGSGRIRMPDGNVLRVHYADQNGHPFRPMRVVSKSIDRVVTRGAAAQEEPDTFELLTGEEDDVNVLTRGAGTARRAPAPTPSNPSQRAATDALVQQLLKPGAAAAARPNATAPTSSSSPPAAPPRNASALSSDPSYVFFRVAANQSPGTGPQGALGVPLTPGRSIAVDPRATPLGYPVYLSAAGRSAADTFQRLVLAQDTGGAIRGAVRADYFWGFGAEAGRLAQRTKHKGRMWVLMPNAEAQTMRPQRVVTRGAAGSDIDRECLVADEQYCPETQ
jgi:membrane-bound lytic murein transglycosylase A